MGPAVGPYRVVSELGRGGMGVVFEAVAPDGQRVALKLLLQATPEVVDRFRREADALRFLSRHQGIVTLRDLGLHEGKPYLVMDLVEGGSLERRLAAGVVDEVAGARLLVDVARALHFAHEAGWVHRDVKPANVLLDGVGRPLLGDFGVARDLRGAALTRTGDLLGTLAYMAPEQADGRHAEVDRRTDVFALGGVLYEVLTGRAPVEATGATALVEILTGPPPPPGEVRPGASPGLAAVCMRALARAPEERHPTAEDFARDLEAALGLAPAGAPPARRARGRALAVVAGVLAAAAASFAAGLSTRAPAPPSVETAPGDVLLQAADALAAGRLDEAQALLTAQPTDAPLAARLRLEAALAGDRVDEALALARAGALGAPLPGERAPLDARWARLLDDLAARGRHEQAAALVVDAFERAGGGRDAAARLADGLDRVTPLEPGTCARAAAAAERAATALLPSGAAPSLEDVAVAVRLVRACYAFAPPDAFRDAPPDAARALVRRLDALAADATDERLVLAATPWREQVPRALWRAGSELLAERLEVDARTYDSNGPAVPVPYRIWRELLDAGDHRLVDVPMRWDWVLRRPELSTGWLDLGRRVTTQDPRRAVLLLRRAHALEGTAETGFWLARSARQAGRDDEARRAIDEAVRARGAHDWHLALHAQLWLPFDPRPGGRGDEVRARLMQRQGSEPLMLPRALLDLSRALAAAGDAAAAEVLAQRAQARAFERARGSR